MVAAPDSPHAVAFLVEVMRRYASTVLYPSQRLKRAGLLSDLSRGGLLPIRLTEGLGPKFSRSNAAPVFLGSPSPNAPLVERFNAWAEVYDAYTSSFTQPIFEEALREIAAWLPADARALDAGCGAGRELRAVARMVPDGEVVGTDLAAEMVRSAHRAARAYGLDNCAFFQADVGDLPRIFTEQFDLVYSCLAHHHYPDPAAAARSILRSLRSGGIYCVIDPGPAWYIEMSAPIARFADPGWIRFHEPAEFCRLFEDAGFVRTGWVELLPGYVLATAQKQ
jgi:SAM-dependent methyltransferase